VTATVRKFEKRGAAAAQRDVPSIGLGMLLRDANAVFNRALREELARHKITFSQYQHLRQLWHADGLAQVELSRRIGIETASSTAVLDALEKRGYIRRERDARDRRNVRVFLEPAGAEIEAKLLECAAGINAIAREGLSKADIADFFRIIAVIAGNLEAQDRGASRKAAGASSARSSKPPRSRKARGAT